MVSYLVPIVAVVLGVVVLGEVITAADLIGAAGVVLGAWLLSGSQT